MPAKSHADCVQVAWALVRRVLVLCGRRENMPIYEYVCVQCNQQFELLVRGDEKPACPECGGTRVAKQLSVPSAHSGTGGNSPSCPSECDPRGAAPM